MRFRGRRTDLRASVGTPHHARMITPPTPRPPELPLMQLEWDAFERFCCDLVERLPEVERCHRQGGQGDAQGGIDISATLRDGRQWAFQCKREARFGPAKLRKTIARASFAADRYVLLLASQAKVPLRTEAARHPNWVVWDAEDIARRVRSLPPESARILVETHFGGAWRAAFLGTTGTAQLLSAEEFFSQLVERSRLFHHAWTLIGRQTVLRELQGFFESSSHRIAILTGRGGIGKSKVLHAFAGAVQRTEPAQCLRFLVPDLPLGAGLDELDPVACMVVADDAHRRSDLPALLSAAFRRKPALRLVLALRSHARERVLGDVWRAGFDPTEVLVLDELRELTRGDGEALAREALGPGYAHLAGALVAQCWDSPFMTVLGGQLLQSQQVHPALLSRREEFRGAVLGGFSDALSGELDGGTDARVRRDLLRLASAVGPFRPDLQPFRAAAAAFLGIAGEEMLYAMRELEDAGVLLRRGRTLRVTPDVLADFVLEEACFTRDGTPTGYAGRVHAAFRGIAADALLRNLAELDWRRYRDGVPGSGEALLRGLWDDMEAEFRAANAARRVEMIRALRVVAYYQPGPALHLARIAMQTCLRAPAGPRASEEQSLADAVSVVLGSIAFTLPYTAECCDLLWRLARDDPRESWNGPDHAIGILVELAVYRPGKPLALQEAVVAAVGRWVEEPGAHGHRHSPLDVLDPVFVKTAVMFRPDGSEYGWGPVVIAPTVTAALRARAFAVVARVAGQGELRGVLRAVRSLSVVLQEPLRYAEMEVPDGFEALWRPEQNRALAALAELCAHSPHPLVALECLRALGQARDAGPAEDKQRVSASIPRSFDVRLTETLLRITVPEVYAIEPWRTRCSGLDAHERLEQGRAETAAEFLACHPAPADGLEQIDRVIGTVEAFGMPASCVSLAAHLAASDPDYLAALCERAAAGAPSPVVPHLAALLYRVKEARPERYLQLAWQILSSGEAGSCGAVAQTLWEPEDPPLAEADDLLAAALAHPDEEVRWHALPSLHLLARRDPWRAVERALGMEVGRGAGVADRFAQLFEGAWGITPETLPADAWDPLLRKLVRAEHLGSAALRHLVRGASLHAPRALARMLLARVRLAAVEPLPYEPVPAIATLEGFLRCPDLGAVLREIRDASPELPPPAAAWAPPLYELVSVGYGDVGLGVLREWIDDEGVPGIAGACRLLGAISPHALLQRVDFVQNLLRRADAAGAEVLEGVRCALLTVAGRAVAAQSRVREEWPELEQLREDGRALQERPDLTRVARDFYRGLADAADACLRDAAAAEKERSPL
ncbi:MAG TPA: ATP-binding protein [Longimicrobium sp.]|nr:ATP-binding protein [Longimicrobium sp.]